ncbi:cytochrome c3 family protein [Thermodesulfobacterium hydrogeniphilum]|uniref:cytochrome c3 family protein n=1 Tax=Thermodesulfobacterium hydrogeniphilum TaxID=161156 RepID=UPI00056F9F7F|nr:cytochrome c3 family protein [Thermodesulfobacterium hydrogeniphilum]
MSWLQVIKKALFVLSFLFIVFYFYNYANSESYLNSAHGNGTYGVKRDVTELSDYSQGNCAHCHEMHGSINGNEPSPAGGSPSPWALFADNFNNGTTTGPYSQSDDFCFYCHGPSSLQSNGITNYDYSQTFGGAPQNLNATNIMDAFNQLSYHNLYDIWNFAKQNFSFFKESSNPCVACHNIHIAQRSCGKPEGSFNPSYSAISKPSDHAHLWGDNDTERMNYYASGYTYQAPYWCGTTTYYEPAGDTTYDGSNMPDYVTFCTDCHNNSNEIYSTTLGRNLYKIDWETTGGESGGDKHGKNTATVSTNLKAPYNNATGFVVSCLDCHEPHGAPNVMLIRREVNGEKLPGNITTLDTSNWAYLCGRCHKDDSYYGGSAGEFEYIHHLDTNDAPYPGPPKSCGTCHDWDHAPIKCNKCHFHGGDDSWLQNVYPSEYTGRRCF